MKWLITLLACTCTYLNRDLDTPTIIYNATIHTMSASKIAYGFIHLKGKITKLISNETQFKKINLHYPDAQFTNMNQKLILPGIIDAHGHLFHLGFKLMQVDLSHLTDSTISIKQALKDHISRGRIDKKTWIVGHGWDQNKFIMNTNTSLFFPSVVFSNVL